MHRLLQSQQICLLSSANKTPEISHFHKRNNKKINEWKQKHFCVICRTGSSRATARNSHFTLGTKIFGFGGEILRRAHAYARDI